LTHALKTVLSVAVAVLLLTGCARTAQPDAADPDGAVAAEQSTADGTESEAGDDSGVGVCGGYLEAISSGSDQSVVSAEWLDASAYTQPLGIAVPPPDCALQVEQMDSSLAYYLGWENTDFFDIHDALVGGGLKVMTPWEGENQERKYMMTWEDETGLFWLDSGDGITAGTPVDDVLFVYVE
jgi:hypothetical protein